jgi:hypothetical protein
MELYIYTLIVLMACMETAVPFFQYVIKKLTVYFGMHLSNWLLDHCVDSV